MTEQTLSVETRQTTGKGTCRKIRAAGKLPGVLYGLGKSIPVTVDPKLIQRGLLSEGGRNQIYNLEGAGVAGKHALIKDYQVEPVSRRLVHVDLLEIDITKKINVTVSLNFTGKSAGVAEGGVLNIVERSIEVKCLPNSIPGHIDVDVTKLTIGDSIHLDELTLPEGIEKASHGNPTLCTVVPPAKEEDAAPSLAPTAEPEVITAKKEEGAEGAAAAPAAGGEKKDEKKK
jgi:large subunit ribosomal protein L25